MPVVTKFPSTAQAIVSGWNYPERAYAEDGSNAYSSTDDAEQKYGGWGFTESDIPAGSNITKVEMGAKHYETDPSGYYQYTEIKYVSSSGGSSTYSLTKRSSLYWDWIEITSIESSWDLTKLNNADIRIINRLVASGGGGCFPDGDFEHTYVACGVPPRLKVKRISELKTGDKILSWNPQGGFEVAVVTDIVSANGEFEAYEFWSGEVKIPHINKKWKAHIVCTPTQKLRVFQKIGKGKFAGPIELTARDLYENLKAGAKFWQGHLWNKNPKVFKALEKFLSQKSLPKNWKVSTKDLTIEMFPITHFIKRKCKGKTYAFKIDKHENCFLTKTLHVNEEKLLEKLGLTKNLMEFFGPPFLTIAVKLTSYVDAVALRVTYEAGATEVVVQDSGSGAETVKPQAEIGVSEVAQATEKVKPQAKIDVSESGQSVEKPLIGLKIFESGFGTENVELKAEAKASEYAQAIEKPLIGLKVLEQGITVEKASLEAAAKASETAEGTEAVALKAEAKAIESGVGTEAIALKADAKAFESGFSHEKPIIGLKTFDSGSATEKAVLKAQVKASESAFGTEKPSLKAEVKVSEIGVGSDEASTLQQWFGGIKGSLSLQTQKQTLEVKTWD